MTSLSHRVTVAHRVSEGRWVHAVPQENADLKVSQVNLASRAKTVPKVNSVQSVRLACW